MKTVVVRNWCGELTRRMKWFEGAFPGDITSALATQARLGGLLVSAIGRGGADSVDECLRDAGIPLLRVRARAYYSVSWLRTLVGDAIHTRKV